MKYEALNNTKVYISTICPVCSGIRKKDKTCDFCNNTGQIMKWITVWEFLQLCELKDKI